MCGSLIYFCLTMNEHFRWQTFLGLDRGHFLSHTGQCKPFDASADGYARSEGCGMFVLKRLSDAIDDNDNILGVIRNVEVNQSCRAHSIVHPHGPTQVALLRALLANAGVTPNQISVVEAHGTGTQAGDTSELESIRKALALSRTGADPLYVTSIKANIGHLEAASGAAGLAKLLLMLQHSCIAPQISLKNLNPRIAPLEQDHTVIATKPTPWRRLCGGSVPRMAVLNNYGASGSNVALLLEEWVPPTRGPDPGAMAFVFGMSAKTSEALEDLRAKYLEWLSDCGDGKALCLPDLAYTMTARRQVYHHRLAVAASSREELVEGLTAAEVKVTSRDGGQSKRVVFVFAGQGAYYLNMGASLYHSSPVFRNRINECDGILLSNGFVGVRGTFDHSARNAYSLSEEIQTCQTSLFALEFALAKLWMSWGAEPVAVIGHR
jgi:acyl transferase domain-containing protein